MEELFVLFGVIMMFCLGSCVGCAAGEDEGQRINRQKMIELNLAHYDQNTGKYVQDSLSCVNDSCVIVRKNGE